MAKNRGEPNIYRAESESVAEKSFLIAGASGMAFSS
jgi:hypothetical protein